MSQLIQTVKDKASEGALDSILSFFHIFFNAHPSLNFFLNEWLLIEGNYNNVVKDFGQGIVSSEFYHAKIAQSRKAVLQVLDDLDEQLETDLSFNDAVAKADFLTYYDSKKTLKKEKSSLKSNFWLVLGVSLLLGMVATPYYLHQSSKKSRNSQQLIQPIVRPIDTSRITLSENAQQKTIPVPLKSKDNLPVSTISISKKKPPTPPSVLEDSATTKDKKPQGAVEKPLPIPAIENKEIVLTIIVDSKDAHKPILIDGQAAKIIKNDLSIKKILVRANTRHDIQIGMCEKSQYFMEKDVTINFVCD